MEATDTSILAAGTEKLAVFKNSQGLEFQATPLHFDRFVAALEIYTPGLVLRTSEVLTEFRLTLGGQTVYFGQAVVTNLVNAGTVLVCEVRLGDGWLELDSGPGATPATLQGKFTQFLQSWQGAYKVLPEFKLVVADMESLLSGMRLWLDQVELGIRSSPNGDRQRLERDAAHALAGPAIEAIESLGDRFEEVAMTIEPNRRAVHMDFTRRHLHSAFMSSPFAYRTFRKPLGYAGDYEMVNMIVRDPYEGASLFAKVINAWFLQQLPARAHRNRLKLLKQKLIEETARLTRQARPARVFNLGCGPAGEIQEFLAESELCQNTELTLLDFNEETLQHTGAILREISLRFGRRTRVQLQKKSVQQLLKEAIRASAQATAKYDFVYCAGLFDYLPDRVCKQLMEALYGSVAPGGLLLVTNVDGTRPFHNKLEFILDWNLIYRNGRQMAALRPALVSENDCSVAADLSGVNLLMEIRKPDDAQ
jgi:extracellular factor (EF) 3-hydroxypalmitic acid methyl ester biosynthesis protein